MPGTWFASAPGQALLDSEWPHLRGLLGERPGQPWLWLGPVARTIDGQAGPGLPLRPVASGWTGPVRCSLPLPLANESVVALMHQHPALPGAGVAAEAGGNAEAGATGQRFVLSVEQDNPRARAFYESLDLRVVAETDGDFVMALR